MPKTLGFEHDYCCSEQYYNSGLFSCRPAERCTTIGKLNLGDDASPGVWKYVLLTVRAVSSFLCFMATKASILDTADSVRSGVLCLLFVGQIADMKISTLNLLSFSLCLSTLH